MFPFVLLTLVALAALLLSRWRGSQPGAWIAKPLASAGFVAAALAAGATQTPYGRLVLAALVLSWLGDVLLIPKQVKTAFLAGLLAFLLGHVAFAAAFVVRGVSLPALAVAFALVSIPLALALRWLAPHVEGPMKLPVRAYVLVISVMVACAGATVWEVGNPVVLAGALAFYASDLAVARARFVAHGFANELWGLPLYYGAQLLLASTVAG
ncbi:MAG: lysoplasmalogenase [Deltaproteobacteria bacterium]|nr:lysoplasmalogenase [Deltaproteobacteria bacterium]